MNKSKVMSRRKLTSKNITMNKSKVVQVSSENIEFQNGLRLYSEHDQDCCELHYLDFNDLTISDFEGLEFDFTNDNFFKKIEGYGIELIPIHGHSVKIPGYGANNGDYSTELTLVLSEGKDFIKKYNITECQEVNC